MFGVPSWWVPRCVCIRTTVGIPNEPRSTGCNFNSKPRHAVFVMMYICIIMYAWVTAACGLIFNIQHMDFFLHSNPLGSDMCLWHV